jgi:hypothetical protein
MGKKSNGKKKGNVYEADRSMTMRVEDFLRVKIYGLHQQSRLKRDLKKVEEKIAKAPEMLANSVFADKIDELIEGYKAEAETLRKEYKTRMAEAEKFKFTKQDDALYDAYLKNDSAELEKALIEWFKAYKWDTTDTLFLDGCMDAISGLRQAKNSTIVKNVVLDEKGDARAVKFTENRGKNDVLKTLYCYVAEKLIDLKLLKGSWIASDVVAIYKKW